MDQLQAGQLPPTRQVPKIPATDLLLVLSPNVLSKLRDSAFGKRQDTRREWKPNNWQNRSGRNQTAGPHIYCCLALIIERKWLYHALRSSILQGRTTA